MSSLRSQFSQDFSLRVFSKCHGHCHGKFWSGHVSSSHFVFVFLLVMLCLPITLIRCLKGHKSLRVAFWGCSLNVFIIFISILTHQRHISQVRERWLTDWRGEVYIPKGTPSPNIKVTNMKEIQQGNLLLLERPVRLWKSPKLADMVCEQPLTNSMQLRFKRDFPRSGYVYLKEISQRERCIILIKLSQLCNSNLGQYNPFYYWEGVKNWNG